MGLITRAVVRISPVPEKERFQAVFLPDWTQGLEAVRDMIRARLPLSMLRLSDAAETATTLILAGHERLVRLLERFLRTRGLDKDKCMLIFGATGSPEAVRHTVRDGLEIARSRGGVYVGRRMGSEWRRSRFRAPYLRNTLWDSGYGVDTLESAFTWKDLPAAAAAVLDGLRTALDGEREKALAFAHVSHVYRTGASLYFTVIFRLAAGAEETLERWRSLKRAASLAVVSHGGTISHQHGVGVDHLPYLEAEKGRLGMRALRSLFRTFDPRGMMNPGKLVDGGKRR